MYFSGGLVDSGVITTRGRGERLRFKPVRTKAKICTKYRKQLKNCEFSTVFFGLFSKCDTPKLCRECILLFEGKILGPDEALRQILCLHLKINIHKIYLNNLIIVETHPKMN